MGQAKDDIETGASDPNDVQSLRDVARVAGVSYMTVLRALNHPEIVRQRTREKIDAAIRESGYVPNLIAKGLNQTRTGVVSMLVPSLNNAFWASLVEGVNEVLVANERQLLLGSLQENVYKPGVEEDLIAAFLGRRPDGIILVPFGHTDVTRSRLAKAKVPTVEVAGLPDHPLDSVIGFSNFEAFRALGGALVDKGYRRFAYLMSDFQNDEIGNERLRGLRSALKAAGLNLPDTAIVRVPPPPTLAGAGDATAALLKRAPDIDVLICSGDYMAHGALLRCMRDGVAVPDRLAITGFGNMELSSQIEPGLTTIRVDGLEIGRRAARHLLDRVDGTVPDPIHVDVGFDIVFRQSA